MKKFYYCPSCGKETVVTNNRENPYRGEDTILNIRDGFGRSIRHYKCECGNYLAGCMNIEGFDDHGVDYAKSIIKGYQRDGKLLGADGEKWFADAKKVYNTMHSYPERSNSNDDC